MQTQIKIIPVREDYGTDYYVYVGDDLKRVCPSLDMAREVASGLAS